MSGDGPEFRAMTLPDGGGIPFHSTRQTLIKRLDRELQSALGDFQEHNNNYRPHLGLGGSTPANFRRGLQPKPQRKERSIPKVKLIGTDQPHKLDGADPCCHIKAPSATDTEFTLMNCSTESL